MIYLIPQYAPNMPTPNLCESCGCNEFPIVQPNSSGGKPTFVIAGPGIGVNDLSDANAYRYEVHTEPIIDLTVSLTLIAKESGVTKSNPVLKGTVIDEVDLAWTYNKAVTDQTLTNTGGLTAPTLGDSDANYNYTSQTLDSNTSFTINGDDGLGLSGSEAADTKSISFGNLMWLGYGSSLINASTSGAEAFIEGLQTSVIKTSRVHTYYATGGANQKHFVAYPKAFGFATFTKGIFSGGYVRLKKVGSILKSDLGMSDVESDLIITNSKGYAEAYYIYESLFDNQADAVTPYEIS